MEITPCVVIDATDAEAGEQRIAHCQGYVSGPDGSPIRCRVQRAKVYWELDYKQKRRVWKRLRRNDGDGWYYHNFCSSCLARQESIGHLVELRRNGCTDERVHHKYISPSGEVVV